MIETDKIGKSSPSRLGTHSPEDASFFPNLAIQKAHLKLSPTSPQRKSCQKIEDCRMKVSITPGMLLWWEDGLPIFKASNPTP